ncbi:hypothetical protein KKA09_00720 [Patescibacteria group bacterium]|nr:hypothetical protein [Patescibacteria group bacterium]
MNEIKSSKNIYPWILNGISLALSIFAYIFFVYRAIPGELFSLLSKTWFNVMFFYFLIAIILGIMGLVIGIKRRKTGGRLLGILGIVIPIIIILLAIFSGFCVELSIILMTT